MILSLSGGAGGDDFITFDIETAKTLPRSEDPTKHLPVGVTVAACRLPSGEIRYWHGGTPEAPTPFMTRVECAALVRDLQSLTSDGTRLVSWNGASFDFLVLAYESGLWEECATLARRHTDVAFHFLCDQGFMISMEAAGRVLGLSKDARITGGDAPAAWRARRFSQVKTYLAGDVAMLSEIYRSAARNAGLSWVTRKGATRRWSAPSMLSVAQATRIPLPDTSWMRDPIGREQCVGWIVRKPYPRDSPPYEAEHEMQFAADGCMPRIALAILVVGVTIFFTAW